MAVSVTSVQKILGETSNNIGKLCTSNKINPFSKYKPVRFISVEQMDDTLFKNADWGYHLQGNCSISQMCAKIVNNTKPSSWTTPSNSVALTDNEPYYYLKPDGGMDSPYRLGDFNGYNHSAKSGPFFKASINNNGSSISLSSHASIETMTGRTLSFTIADNIFALTDFTRISTGYLAIIAVLKSDTSKYAVLTCDNKISSGTSAYTLNIPPVSPVTTPNTKMKTLFATENVEYECILCISNTKHSDSVLTSVPSATGFFYMPLSTFTVKRLHNPAEDVKDENR